MHRKILEKIISYEENHIVLYFNIAISDLIFAFILKKKNCKLIHTTITNQFTVVRFSYCCS